MSSAIHPTAVIEPTVKLGQDVKVGPYCVLTGNVVLGDRVELLSHVCVAGHTTIGEETKIYPFASIGHAPQDLKYHGEPSTLTIGARNVIREYCTMQPGTETGGMKTTVGDDCLFMAYTHVAHDCHVGSHVIMANAATLAGHVTVHDYAIIGGLAAIHQFVRIGQHAMVGGMSGITQDVIPYGMISRDLGFLTGLNLIGLKRRGFSRDEISELRQAYDDLFSGEGSFGERLERLGERYADSHHVMEVIHFIRSAERSVVMPRQV
ncbi:MAG: acyl-ACP--UDP-N-acetylglucosamine O-acyltransferase [Holosporales bacterium]